MLFLYAKAPPEFVEVPTTTTETLVTPEGAIHVYEESTPE
jgi:hypothetical protein